MSGSVPEGGDELRELAAKGDPVAMYFVGKDLAKTDPQEARRLLEASAEQGLINAINVLARLLKDSEPETARMWLERAAAAGDISAMANLGLLLRDTDPGAARDWSEAAAASGGAVDAWFNHGALLMETGQTRAAVVWFIRAATAGDERASHNLGLIYRDEGQPDQAMVWFEHAARRGDRESMSILGQMLMDVDPVRSRVWLEKAADAGDKDAAYNLGITARRDAQKWFEMLAQDGDGDAMLGLAYLLRGSDPDIARTWVERAIAIGHGDAADSMDHLFGEAGAAPAAEPSEAGDSARTDAATAGASTVGDTEPSEPTPRESSRKSRRLVEIQVEGVSSGVWYVSLERTAEGGYLIAGQHIWDSEADSPFGQDDYEYWLNIPASGVAAFAAALGTEVDGIPGAYEAQAQAITRHGERRWLDEHRVPYKFDSF